MIAIILVYVLKFNSHVIIKSSQLYEQFRGIHVDEVPDILLENLSELSDRREEFILDPWKTFELTLRTEVNKNAIGHCQS